MADRLGGLGYRQGVLDADALGQSSLRSGMGVLQAMHMMQMAPLQADALRGQIADREGLARYRDAQIVDMQRKAAQGVQSSAALGQLAGVLSSGGYTGVEGQGAPPPTAGVSMSDDAALSKFGMRKNPDGSISPILGAVQPPPESMSVNVPNPGAIRGLGVLADPQHAIPEVLKSLRPDKPLEAMGLHPVVVQDQNSPTGWSHKDLRTGNVTPGAPPPASPLVPVKNAEGKAVYATRSSAEGKEVGSASATGAELTPEELGPMAWEKLLFGTNPPGMGNASAAQRKQVNEERARLGRSLGLSDMEMAMLPQDNKVKMKAVDTLTKWAATVGRSAEKLDLDLGVAIDYAKRLPLQQLQIVNKGIIAGMKEFNSPDANAYATAINSVRQEYARLMSGPTSNAMLPVEAMKKGNELLSSGVDVPSLEEVGRQMRRDAANTMTATNNGIGSLRGSISSLGKEPAFPTNRGEIPEFATEAEAARAMLKPGTKVKIGGKTGTWQ